MLRSFVIVADSNVWSQLDSGKDKLKFCGPEPFRDLSS